MPIRAHVPSGSFPRRDKFWVRACRPENPRRVSWPLLPPSYERTLGQARRVELASDRRFRARNKISYRLAHWPIWIFVFFIAPGPLTFDLFERGFDWRMAAWLALVLAGTGIAGLRGRLPGVEPAPYILRFTEDRPNPTLPPRLLHARLERGDRLRGAEHRRPRLCDCHGRVAAAADVRRRLFPDRHHDLDARRGRPGCRA